MAEFTAAVVGTGPDPHHPTVESFAMGYRHAEAYEANGVPVVACADLDADNAAAFAETFGVPDEHVFEDYVAMAEAVEPDVVSVTVPPGIHEEVVTGLARTDSVAAVHCEKPMALTWTGARDMVQACWRRDVQLTINRQRRFGRPFTRAKELLDAGAVGDLQRVEIGWGDFFDTGAHTVDLATMFAGDVGAEWVLAGLDYRDPDRRFGVHQENQMWAQWRYENGVYGVVSTGPGSEMVGAAMRLSGTEGTIAIDVTDGPMLAVTSGGERTVEDVDGEDIHRTPDEDDRYGSRYHDRAVADLIEALAEGTESSLSGRNGLNTAEILFGGYESVRRRGRVDLPLRVGDNAFTDLVERGELGVDPSPVEE